MPSSPAPPDAQTGTSSLSSASDSMASEDSAADSGIITSAMSAQFRRRMQPCREPVMKRSSCPCCLRNFLQASEKLEKFREHLRQKEQTNKEALDNVKSKKTPEWTLASMSQTERGVLLSDDFLCRLLARCGCDFSLSLERLLVAVAVHRKYTLDTSLACSECAERQGYHSFRQVGFDRVGRPVLYTCLNQDIETGVQPEQVRNYFLHMILTVREAEKTMPSDQHSLVIVFDTTGLGMSHVRTDTVSQFGEMLRYFPARMSYSLALNMNRVTRFLLKPIIHLTGHQDDIVLLSSCNLESQLADCFDQSLARWMAREVERNLTPRMPFWAGPTASSASTEAGSLHDPRGERFYVENYIKKRHPSGHRPHPSIELHNLTKSS